MNKRIFLSEDKYFDIDTKEIKPQETIFLTFDLDNEFIEDQVVSYDVDDWEKYDDENQILY